MIVALCPLLNSADTARNLAAIEEALGSARDGGAALAVFPECGLFGFGARRDLLPPQVQTAVAQVAALARRFALATLMPMTDVDRLGRPRNRAVLFDASGAPVAAFEKTSLTASERRYFSAAAVPRRRTFDAGGRRFAVVFCIEIEDPSGTHFDTPVDAVLWPGYWGHAEPFDWWGATAGGAETIRAAAAAWGAPVLQANFARPTENAPQQAGTWLGGSLAVRPDGALIVRPDPHSLDPLLVPVPRRC